MALKKKLFECLEERAEIQSRLARLAGRLEKVAVVRVGREPLENPDKLRAELDSVHGRLCRLQKIIVLANNDCRLEDGRTLAEAIVDRDILGRRIAALRGVVSTASNLSMGYGEREVLFEAKVDVLALQTQADELAREQRVLDIEIQRASWSFEVEV